MQGLWDGMKSIDGTVRLRYGMHAISSGTVRLWYYEMSLVNGTVRNGCVAECCFTVAPARERVPYPKLALTSLKEQVGIIQKVT